MTLYGMVAALMLWDVIFQMALCQPDAHTDNDPDFLYD